MQCFATSPTVPHTLRWGSQLLPWCASNGKRTVVRTSRLKQFVMIAEGTIRGAEIVDGVKQTPVPRESLSTDDDTPLELTLENVETVLDELRPYLMADGGNVSVKEIDGATVRLILEGACGSCPSSTMTMQMGLERRLLERIPEIENVVAIEPEGPPMDEEGIERVLNEVRPFLNVAGGTIELVELNVDSTFPNVRLKMTGSGAAINSVKVEITHRIKRNYPKIAQVQFD